MTDFAPSYHEAAHAVVGHELGFDTMYLSLRKADDSIARTKINPTEIREGHELDFVIVLLAGEMAERFHLGRELWHRLDWFASVDNRDDDMTRAREWIAAECARNEKLNEIDVRAWAQLRARGIVFSRWPSIEAVAKELERREVLLGEQVSKIILAENARRSARSQTTNVAPRHPRNVERRPIEYRVVKGAD